MPFSTPAAPMSAFHAVLEHAGDSPAELRRVDVPSDWRAPADSLDEYYMVRWDVCVGGIVDSFHRALSAAQARRDP